MQESLIPLFPLEVVLFPGNRLPLHIFEERYKIMIRECLETEGPREFGVVLAKPNGIANVGCTAEVVEVVRSYADGRMDIVTAGRRRFEALFVDESKEYLRATPSFSTMRKVRRPTPYATAYWSCTGRWFNCFPVMGRSLKRRAPERIRRRFRFA